MPTTGESPIEHLVTHLWVYQPKCWLDASFAKFLKIWEKNLNCISMTLRWEKTL